MKLFNKKTFKQVSAIAAAGFIAVSVLPFSVFAEENKYTIIENSNIHNYSLTQILERFGDIDEVLRQLDLNKPKTPIQPFAIGGAEESLISESLYLETQYIFDEISGEYLEVLTDESKEKFWNELFLRVNNDILSPEWEQYFYTLEKQARLVIEIADYLVHGYVAVRPMSTLVDAWYRARVTFLDMHDGISASDAARITALGELAYFTANITPRPIGPIVHPLIDDVAWRDAYRHYSWSFIMVNGHGRWHSLIAGNNHEWVGIMPNTAPNQMVATRARLGREMLASQAVFNTHVDNDTMMDFWNNRAGVRAAGGNTNVESSFWNDWLRGNIIGTIWGYLEIPAHFRVTAANRSEMRLDGWFVHFPV